MPLDDLAVFGQPQEFSIWSWEEDPRGEAYGYTWNNTGRTLSGIARELSATESFRMGREASESTWRVRCSRNDAEKVSRNDQIRGELFGKLNVVQVTSYEAHDLAAIVGVRGDVA